MSDHDQISLFEQDAPAQTWPDASRFPLNLVGEGTVAGVVEKDLAGCADALVVAGYAGLGRLVSFLGKQSLSADQPFRLLLGMAERWLDLIRPVWYQALQERRRRRPLRLADLRPHLLGEHKLSIDDLRATFETVPRLPPVEERIAACVLGVPGGA